MVVKNKKSLTKSMEQKEQCKEIKKIKKNRTKKTIFIILLLILAVITTLILLNAENSFRTSKIANIATEQNQQQNNYFNDAKDSIEILTERIITLERTVRNNNEYIKNLQAKVNELEIRINRMSIEPQKIELIKLAVNIKNNIENKISYLNNLALFKSLVQKNNRLIEKVSILELHQNNFPTDEIIFKNFDVEMNNFIKETNLLKKNNDNFSKFLSKFMIIRKINNADEDSSDAFIFKLENYMKSKSYNLAFELIQRNTDYIQYFPKTLENLRVNILINMTAQEILEYLMNN